MAYSAYDDKRIALGQAFKTAVKITDLGADNYLDVVKARTQKFYLLITDLADQLVGERPPEPKRGGGGNYGGGGSGKPSTRSTLDKVSIDYFENGQKIDFYDQRPAKADGRYSAKAPDFQSVDKFDLRGDGEAKNIPIWLVNADGSLNVKANELLVASGVSLDEPTPGSFEEPPAPSADVF